MSRFIWALVHSSETSNVKLGLDMAKVFLEEELTTDSRRNVKYCIAVALFKSRSYVAARRELNLIIEVGGVLMMMGSGVEPMRFNAECSMVVFLQEFKDFRQAIHLKELTEEKLVREGVIGVAIAGATVVGAGAIAIAASLLKR